MVGANEIILHICFQKKIRNISCCGVSFLPRCFVDFWCRQRDANIHLFPGYESSRSRPACIVRPLKRISWVEPLWNAGLRDEEIQVGCGHLHVWLYDASHIYIYIHMYVCTKICMHICIWWVCLKIRDVSKSTGHDTILNTVFSRKEP